MADVPSSNQPEPVSSALLANLAETRREVVVPQEYRALLEPVEQYYGVRRTVDKLLTELFHPLRNLREITAGLRSVCGSMFHYYERSPSRASCAALLNRVFGDLYDGEPRPDELGALVGVHLQLVVNLTRSQHPDELTPPAVDALERLRRVQERDGAAFLPYSGLVRRVGQRLDGEAGVAEGFAAIYRGLAEAAAGLFEERVDLEGWRRLQPEGVGEECAGRVVAPLSERIAAAREVLGRAEAPAQLFELPNVDDLLNLVLESADRLESHIERIALYVHLAGVPELQHRNMEVLRSLYFSIKKACEEGTEEEVLRAVDLITGHLWESRPTHKTLLYRCLEKLGEGIAPLDNDRIATHFVERAIATGFEGPDISGVSEEWEVHVNPHHLPCVRAWLGIIENDPIQFEKLLSALVLNLHFRGVFVSDTDLFQRDISGLLNTDIADAFSLIMQLVAYFPVFFNEVGSEGELRTASTRIDQLAHRQDPVIHYLRKQCHAESNNRLIGFARSVWAFWHDGAIEPLAPYLPESILGELVSPGEWYRGVHEVVAALEEEGAFTEADLDEKPLPELEEALSRLDAGTERDRERVALLVTVYRLLKAKYGYEPETLVPTLERSRMVASATREAFVAACSGGDHLEIVRQGNRVLAELKAVVVDTEVTEAFENIFLKRHIAAGIPSMYGTYREPKFDAMGLMIRLITFLNPHLEACVADFNYRYMTRASIRAAHQLVEQMLIGLEIGGLRVRQLEAKLDVLRRGIAVGHLSASQYLNIFDFLSEALANVVETNYIDLHEGNLESIARQRLEERGEAAGQEAVDRLCEEFLRHIIASTYAIQELDLFLRRVRQSLRGLTEALSPRACDRVLAYQPERLVSYLDEPVAEHEDQLVLGFKGSALKRLKALGLPVPEGFVLSTELYNIRPAMRYADIEADTRERVVSAVDRLEERTGKRLGDPERPLLLSVRSGSAFSMPGMMTTILDVGLNRGLVERIAEDEELAWGIWDSYRRYLQNVAMAQGVERDLFDDIMLRFKERHEVERKVGFDPLQMREIALAYQRLAAERGVVCHESPVDQLMQAISLVLDSWESEAARVYRRRLQLSDDWGTGVIVQEMVFGNFNDQSGSGVVFTRDPRSTKTGIRLSGDFTRCSQGEDVVAGLVHPRPISERRRREAGRGGEISLEKDFPGIYGRLKEIADTLINEHGYEHQEIEFTFASADPDDLYLLQVRPMRASQEKHPPVLARPDEAAGCLLGTGIGVSGGAMVGVVAFSEEDVRAFRRSHPEIGVILVRPDTVPEEINLLLAADGVLTSRGGFTSHAAVTAKRLGKCCVVNCTEMEVSEGERVARVGGRILRPGDVITIDGLGGGVYFGEHETVAAAARAWLG